MIRSDTRRRFFKPARDAPRAATAYFDWFDDAVSEIPTPSNTEGAYQRLHEACTRHIERGGQIVRFAAGVERNPQRTILGEKPIQDRVEPTTWRANDYTSPFGALLDGTQTGLDSLTDAYLLLGVESLWIIGCLHGIDGTTVDSTGKRAISFYADENYKVGRGVGERIAGEFIKIMGGYDAGKTDE